MDARVSSQYHGIPPSSQSVNFQASQPVTMASAMSNLISSANSSTRLSTGSNNLNRVLYSSKGIPRKSIIEISGPPGSGRTSIALDLTSRTVKQSHSALWLTSSSCLPIARLNLRPSDLQRVSHITVASLVQLIVLFTEPPAHMPPKNCSLIVIDDLSALVASSYSTFYESLNDRALQVKRKTRVLNKLYECMKDFAKKHNLVIVTLGKVLSQYSFTRKVSYLVPILGYGSWNVNIDSRVILYKDALPKIKTPPKPNYIPEIGEMLGDDRRSIQQDEMSYDWYSLLKLQATNSAVHHAARLSKHEDEDPVIMRRTLVALFDIQRDGIADFKLPVCIEEDVESSQNDDTTLTQASLQSNKSEKEDGPNRELQNAESNEMVTNGHTTDVSSNEQTFEHKSPQLASEFQPVPMSSPSIDNFSSEGYPTQITEKNNTRLASFEEFETPLPKRVRTSQGSQASVESPIKGVELFSCLGAESKLDQNAEAQVVEVLPDGCEIDLAEVSPSEYDPELDEMNDEMSRV